MQTVPDGCCILDRPQLIQSQFKYAGYLLSQIWIYINNQKSDTLKSWWKGYFSLIELNFVCTNHAGRCRNP